MKKILFCVLIAVFAFNEAFSQKTEKEDVKYKRSSLCLLMIDESGMPKTDVIKNAFLSAPMPDKYNDHNISERIIPFNKITVTEADINAFNQASQAGKEASCESAAKEPKKKSAFGGMVNGLAKSAASTATAGLVDNASKEKYNVASYKHMNENRVAKEIFDKWFKDNTGAFSMGLIQERGMYDASVLDVQKAKSTTKGMGMLADAGEELLNNTFVVVTRFRYLSKDQIVEEIEQMAKATAQLAGPYGSLGASAGTLALKASLGAGYYVQTTSFLYQLNWNEDIANTFYSQLWSDPDSYETSDIFGVKFIGKESAWANVKAGIFTDKDESELIRIATINAMDAVLAKLEKKYEVFKTKTPLFTVEPNLTAQIGTKEGLEAGDKFEVLEKIVDPETNRTSYKRKAVLKVAKDQIWDNRYMANEERTISGEQQDFQATRFEGSVKDLYQGMLLRQIK